MENVVRIDSAKIDDIWDNHIKNMDELNPDDRIIIDRGYHIEEELPKDGILFLGMNPSYSNGDESYINKDEGTYGATYKLRDIKDVSLGLQESEKINKKYWKPIVDAAVRITRENIEMQIMQLKQMLQENSGRKKEDIERELKRLHHKFERCLQEVEFCHHDLFFVRETNQNKVLALKAKCRDFFTEQWKYSKGIIEKASPKIIIVINGGAGNLIREELGTDFFGFIPGASWNEECGVDIVKIGEREVPIIFTGMLSSTGRINKGTETTLFWNIRHIARQLKITF